MWKLAIVAILIIAFLNQSKPTNDVSNTANTSALQLTQPLSCPEVSQQDPVKRERFTVEFRKFTDDCLPTLLTLAKDFDFGESLATNSVNLVLNGDISINALTCFYDAYELESLCPNQLKNILNKP